MRTYIQICKQTDNQAGGQTDTDCRETLAKRRGCSTAGSHRFYCNPSSPVDNCKSWNSCCSSLSSDITAWWLRSSNPCFIIRDVLGTWSDPLRNNALVYSSY